MVLFDHLKVIELAGDPAGEMTGKIFAQMGADVVKVEPPAGSPTRSIGPFVEGHEDADHSLSFWYYNTDKRSVVIDYATPAGRSELLRLLADADICITTLRPPDARALGLEAEQLRTASPRLIVVSVTPFGLTGPWADRLSSDLVGLALGTPLNSCGYDDHSIPPIRPGGDQGYQSAVQLRPGRRDARPDRARANGSGPARRRGDARLPRRRCRTGQPVLVLPESHRPPADVPPRPADAHPAGDLPVRRRPLGVLRDLRRRPEGVADAASSG